MSVKDFQAFIAADEDLNATHRCTKTVDVLRLHRELVQGSNDSAGGREGSGGASTAAQQQRQQNRGGAPAARVALVLDSAQCLDRLYGGFFSDWCCGGQWAHMLDFLATLMATLQQSNVHLAVFLNGAHEAERCDSE